VSAHLGTAGIPLLFDLRRLFSSQGDPGASATSLQIDPSFKRIMVYLFIGTRGGQNRAKIVELLHLEPANSNRVSEKLGLDYKTVQHHVKLLEENGVIVSSAKGTYGAMYFLTPYFEKYFDSVRGMWAKIGQS
jgi:DNA-binding transcriptional ArsR family regulator